MSEFARQQQAFQRAVVEGDETVLAEILDSPRENRTVLFGVYRNAYVLRLVEVVRNAFAMLHGYLGDEVFDEMARAYVAAHPSQHPNLRWYGQGLPAFLAATEPYDDHPVLAELAGLEKTLDDAFDAADAPVAAVSDFAAFAPEDWTRLEFQPHPSAFRLDHATNASAVWSALKEDEQPPDAEALAEPERLIVWRHDTTSMFRPMAAEEAMMWDEACRDIPFGVLCTMLATYDDPDNAAARAAGYLSGWIGAGLIAGVRLGS